MDLYGRNRESVLDLESEIFELFRENPNHWIDETRGVPVINPSDVPFVLRSWAERHGSGELLSQEELSMFLDALNQTTSVVFPDMIIPLIAIREKGSPTAAEDSDSALDTRQESPSRSSSPESLAQPRRRGSLSGGTPDSPFDARNRQRARPLTKDSAPSSWASKRPAPAARRKSDAGSGRALSDSESSPIVTRHTGRSRAPSTPASPTTDTTLFSPSRSPFSSRPPSRSNSRTGFYGHQQEIASPGSLSPLIIDDPRRQVVHVASHGRDDSDEEDDYDQTTRFSRLSTASNASLAPEDRVEGLTKANEEAIRKLMDVEATLTRKMAEHEDELATLEARVQELRQELAAKNREEKELRTKDRASSMQIMALETEVARLQRSVDGSKAAYQALHKQYQEQCAESEKYRTTLRTKEEEIAQLNHLLERSTHEEEKRDQSYKASETRIMQLEQELISMREAEGNLDLQKAENLMLKETIDRLRFELDEITAAAASGTGMSTGPPSNVGTISKSLGAEMARSMQEHFIPSGDSFDEGLAGDSGEETEAEEIQTIITRKRKVAGRANKSESFVQETIKEYSDAWAQYDAAIFTSSTSTQTDITQAATPPRAQSPTMEGTSSLVDASTLVEDQPPSYVGSEPLSQDLQKQIAMNTLKDWHPCRHSSMVSVPQGVSQEALDDWDDLKREIGIECNVINRALEASQRIPTSRRRKSGSRFYKIYNTYIFGDNGIPASSIYTALGVVAVAVLVQPFFAPGFSNLGPSYHDRLAWASANTVQATGEGFDDTQAHALAGLLSRVVLGGAQMAAGRLRPAIVPT